MSLEYRVQNPVTNKVEESFPTATDQQIQDTLEAAHAAYPAWRERPIEERAGIIARAAELFRERTDELAAIIATEMGKPLDESKGEVEFSADILDYYAKNGPTLTQDQPLTTDSPGTAILRTLPIGPLLGIMPWNYPYYQVARFAGPNLVLGNTIILKHAEICPRSSAAIADIFTEAGVPQGVYNNVYASHDQVSTIIADPRIQGVSLTGSERAGSAVAAHAGQHLKKCVLELGGNDPYIILSTSDAPSAAREALTIRFENTGQACNSNKRMIVMEDIYDEFVAELVKLSKDLTRGNPMEPQEGTYSPLSSRAAAERLHDQVTRAKEAGATIHCGGEIDETTAYFSPAVITDIPRGSEPYYEEFFGPCAVVYKASSPEEAIEIANDNLFGLGGSVHSTEPGQAEELAKLIESGMTHANAPSAETVDLPFGGVKRSGYGRELGHLAIYEFANKQLYYTA